MHEISHQHAAYARNALENVRREYPNLLMHFASDEAACVDLRPKVLHPVFYGSYDWHSCVHMHWSLARLLNLYPSSNEAKAISMWFDRQFSPGEIGKELGYLEKYMNRVWERPYGWAWLLKLYAELAVSGHAHASVWCEALQPLADFLSDALFRHWEAARAPVRHGVHSNSAFAMVHALRYATTVGDYEFSALITEKANTWFGGDSDYRMAYDFSAEDFLSPALTEALLMSIVLAKAPFAEWLDQFLPQLAEDNYQGFGANEVADEQDAKGVHNHGLNLSRAWCLRGMMQSINPRETRWQRFGEFAGQSERAAQKAILGGDYVSTHWLISFALLAETEWHM